MPAPAGLGFQKHSGDGVPLAGSESSMAAVKAGPGLAILDMSGMEIIIASCH
jgi:hypothetical protein